MQKNVEAVASAIIAFQVHKKMRMIANGRQGKLLEYR